MLAADVGDAASWYDRDRVTVPDQPGLGVAVAEAAVRRLGEGWWTMTT